MVSYGIVWYRMVSYGIALFVYFFFFSSPLTFLMASSKFSSASAASKLRIKIVILIWNCNGFIERKDINEWWMKEDVWDLMTCKLHVEYITVFVFHIALHAWLISDWNWNWNWNWKMTNWSELNWIAIRTGQNWTHMSNISSRLRSNPSSSSSPPAWRATMACAWACACCAGLETTAAAVETPVMEVKPMQRKRVR